MEVIEIKNNVKCEMGACNNRATHAVKFDRVGIRARLYMCDKCMEKLYAELGAHIVPKSIETAKKRSTKPRRDSEGKTE